VLNNASRSRTVSDYPYMYMAMADSMSQYTDCYASIIHWYMAKLHGKMENLGHF